MWNPAGETVRTRLRLHDSYLGNNGIFNEFDSQLSLRRKRSYEFFASITPPKLTGR